MKSKLFKIIKEELVRLLKENYDEDTIYSYFEREDEIKSQIFYEFLNQNNENFTAHIRWKLIPFPRLKKIWEDYMRVGVVRDTKGLEMIEDIVTLNSFRLKIITYLLGHTSASPDDDYEENIGYYVDMQLDCIAPQQKTDTSQLEIPFEDPQSGYKQKPDARQPEPCRTTVNPYVNNLYAENYEEGITREKMREIIYNDLVEKFTWYFTEDPKSGQAYISDYGINAIVSLSQDLFRLTEPEQKLVTIDKILNVVHQRSDMAGWFVEGGARALSQLSGYRGDEEDSTISGNYNMGDYY